MRGRTTRLILKALVELSEGHDVCVVGFSSEESRSIASKMIRAARAFGIPTRNSEPRSDAPAVRFRPYDEPVTGPTTRARVFIDHKAQFERGNVAGPAERTVLA